jgi:DNA replication protein DnaC
MKPEDIEYLKRVYETKRDEYFLYVELVNANIPLQYRDLEFDDLKSPQLESSKKKILSYIDALITKGIYSPKIRGKGFYIYGGHGSAKTALACLFAKEIIRRTKYSVYYVSFLEALDYFKENRYFQNYNFLIVDDFGHYDVPPFMIDKFEALIKSRYGKGNPTIITSFLDPAGLGEIFGKSFYSLLFECFYFIDHRKVTDWRFKK